MQLGKHLRFSKIKKLFIDENNAECKKVNSEGVVYVGPTGSGKTYCAVSDVVRAGGLVYSTIPIRHPNIRCVLFDSVEDLIAHNPKCASILIDDVAIWLNAQDWTENKKNKALRNLLVEHRHRHLRVVTTSQKVGQNDIMLRNICHFAVVPTLLPFPFLNFVYPESRRGKMLCSAGTPVTNLSRGNSPLTGTIISKREYDIDAVEYERRLGPANEGEKLNYNISVEIWDNDIADGYKSLGLASN